MHAVVCFSWLVSCLFQVNDDDHSEEPTCEKGSCDTASQDLRKLVKRPVDALSHGKDEDDLPPLIQVLPGVVVD